MTDRDRGQMGIRYEISADAVHLEESPPEGSTNSRTSGTQNPGQAE
jgi:hypothetical protein